MPRHRSQPRHTAATLVDRAARIAFTFVMLNYTAVAGLVAALRRRRVW